MRKPGRAFHSITIIINIQWWIQTQLLLLPPSSLDPVLFYLPLRFCFDVLEFT